MVLVPTNVTADEMRATKPTLFLAILAAAAGKEDSELSAVLDRELLLVYATRGTINSEKSLELVQALLTSTVWYHPPRKFGQLKYYEYTHMAAIMAMDLGICSRPRKYRPRFDAAPPAADGVLRNAYQHPAEDVRDPDLSMAPRPKEDIVDTTSVESRRTFLAIFMVCVGVSLSLRRPNIMQNTTYLRECVDVIGKSSVALEADRMIVAWARLLMIAEEIYTSFSYSDLGNVASLAELKTQMMVREFQKRLHAWWVNTPEAGTSGALTIMYHAVRLNLYEVGMHVEHSPDDFKAPHQMGLVQPYDGPEIPTHVLAEAIAGCITSSHAICNAFLSMDVERLRCLPIFSYVRLSYATFILVKLCLSSVHPTSRIAQVLDPGSLKVESYVDRMILHARNIVGPTRCRIPAIFLALLFKLRQWCLHPEMIVQADHHPSQTSSAETSAGTSNHGLDQGEEHSSSRRDQQQIFSTYNSPATPDLDDSNATIPAHTMIYTNYGPDANNNPADSGTNSTGVARPPPPPSTDYAQPTQDQMELDKDFMDLWNEMNGFPEGGLTGLEDWDQLPTDMMGTTFMSDMSTWPNMGAMM
nr:transcriptional regulator war1 [Quercus suber]